MPARYRVYTAPNPSPGTITLQASAATWDALAREIGRTDRALGTRILRQMAGDAADGAVVRMTFPEKQARKLLQLAGVSA